MRRGQAPTDALGNVLADVIEGLVAAAVARHLDTLPDRPLVGAVKVSTAADMCDVGRSSIDRAIRSGELPCVELAGVRHVPLEALDRWSRGLPAVRLRGVA